MILTRTRSEWLKRHLRENRALTVPRRLMVVN